MACCFTGLRAAVEQLTSTTSRKEIIINTRNSQLTTATALLLWLSLAAPALAKHQNVNPDGPAVFTAINAELHMTGTIFVQTVNRFHAAVPANPGVRTLVLHDVPGSDDHNAALQLFRAVRNRGMDPHVPADGIVPSGGVQLFCAGVNRSAEPVNLLLVYP